MQSTWTDFKQVQSPQSVRIRINQQICWKSISRHYAHNYKHNYQALGLLQVFEESTNWHERRKGGNGRPRPPGYWNPYQKKVIFLVLSGKNPNSPLFPPLENLGKIPHWRPLEKILPKPMPTGLCFHLFAMFQTCHVCIQVTVVSAQATGLNQSDNCLIENQFCDFA